MQNKIIELRKKIEEVYDGSPWYGESVKSILRKIDSEDVLKTNSKNIYNIAEIVTHMISWREFTLSRLIENKNYTIKQEETFDWKRIDSNEKTLWHSLLDALEQNQKAILEKLNKSDDTFLDMPVHERNYNMEYLLEGMIQHDIYHSGQVSLLKKLYER